MSITGNQQSDFKLFVGNMPPDVTREEILALFSPFGEVTEVYVMAGSRSRSGQSSAFVKFTTGDACLNAIAELHLKLRVRPTDKDLLSVKFAKAGPPPSRSAPLDSSSFFLDGSSTAASTPASTPLSSPTSYRHLPTGLTKLFVGGLPSYVDRDDLIAMFAPFGRVESVHLMKNNKSKSGQSCAFINFYLRSEAGSAIDSFAGKYVVDPDLPPITVRFADSHDDNGGSKRQKVTAPMGMEDLALKLAEQAAMEIILGVK